MRTVSVNIGIAIPPGNLKAAVFCLVDCIRNFIADNATPMYKSSIEVVAKIISCLKPPVIAMMNEMIQKLMMA